MNRRPMSPRPMRLSTRFAVVVAVLVPLLVLLAGLLVLRLATRDLTAERDRQLAVRLRALTPLATTYVQRARRDRGLTAELTADRLSAAALGGDAPGGIHIEVPDGRPLIVGAVPGTLPPAATTGTVRDGGATARPASFTADGVSWRYAGIDLGRRRTVGRLWVFEPEARLDARIALLRHRLLLATALAVAAGAGAGFAVGRVAVRPLTVLRDQARRVDVDPARRVRLATGSGVVEVDELAGLLNQLLDRRDAAVARTGEALATARAFAASAAHELRTPLTSMGTNLDLLDHPGLGPAERAELVADLTAEHARMQGLITVLRRLAQAELVDPDSFAEVDLAELADAAVEDARRRHQVTEVTVSAGHDVTVHGWADGLRMVVDNLLDNALIHGGTPVTVTVTRAPGAALLAVEDSGPGIPPDQREAIFERFRRRSGSPGSGLGLTLIRQVVLLHGGTVTVTDPATGRSGTRVEVRLPAAGTAPG